MVAILAAGVMASQVSATTNAYSIGLNFGADEFPDSTGAMGGAGRLAPTDVAGAPGAEQANWNNLEALSGNAPNVTADNQGQAATTTTTVDWNSNNTWSSTGRGEENNKFPTNSANYKLMIGYLDSGDPTTSTVTINGLPSQLTSGYDVYVYMLGGTGGNRGGGYRITDASGAILRDYLIGDAPVNPTNHVRDLGLNHNDKGTYLVFRGLTAPNIVIEATTEPPYGQVRAPINAVQLVAATPDTAAPTAPANLTTNLVGAGFIDLTWGVSTDTSTNVYYEIERGTNVFRVSTNSYRDFGLRPTNSYTYRVRAVDESQNRSEYSAPLTVTTIAEVPFVGAVAGEIFDNITGTPVDELLNNEKFVNNTPDRRVYLSGLSFGETSSFGNTFGDNYGIRITGTITVPTNGQYHFFTRSDDASRFYLNTNGAALPNPTTDAAIAEETDCCGAFVEPGTLNTDQTTSPTTATPITLQAGTNYGFVFLVKEGTGGDWGQVALRQVGDTTPAGSLQPIRGSLIRGFVDPAGASITITRQPASATASEGTTASLSVAATITSPYVTEPLYQWFRNGVLIPGATSSNYVTSELSITNDNAARYQVSLTIPGTNVLSEEVTLTVTEDVTPPRVRNVTVNSLAAATVTFDEPVNPATATNASSYTISSGVTVQNVIASASGTSVRLTTSPLTQNQQYTLTVNGVEDRFGNALTNAAPFNFTARVITYADIILADGPIAFFRFEETGGSVATNSGTSGTNAVYYTGDEATPGEGGTPSEAKGDPGPRPPEFLGFDPENRAATFGGSATQDWIDTKNQYLNNLGAFSLEYWVKPTIRVSDPDTFGDRIGIVGQNDAVEYGFINENTIQIWTPASSGGSLDTAYSFPDNEWHHIATIADGRSIKNYYDGKLVGTVNSTGQINSYGSSTFFVHIGGGGVFDVTGNYFTGQIDEVAIFNKAIPAERIAAHFQAGKEGGEAPPPTGDGPTFGAITRSGNQVTLQWTGEGTLEEAPSILGPWTPAASQTNPQTVTADGTKFYRLRQ